jgi:hypothetical protein
MEVCMSDLEPELEQFLDQLDQKLDVDGVSVLSHPALRELSAGTLPIDGLKNWAGQFYHCIRNSARSFGVVFVNLPDEDLDLRRSLAANIFEEDAGGMSGTDNHNELFFGFAQAIGLSREAILATPRGPEAAALMGDFEVRKMSRDEALEWLCDALLRRARGGRRGPRGVRAHGSAPFCDLRGTQSKPDGKGRRRCALVLPSLGYRAPYYAAADSLEEGASHERCGQGRDAEWRLVDRQWCSWRGHSAWTRGALTGRSTGGSQARSELDDL